MKVVEFDEVVRVITFMDHSEIRIHICDVERSDHESSRRVMYFLDEDLKGKQDAMKAIGATDVRHVIVRHHRRLLRNLEEFKERRGL